MSSYIHLKKVFYSDEHRDIESLSTLYNNIELLKGLIKEVSIKDINRTNLNNKRVLLKPNWVSHSKKPSDDLCLRTHDSFLLAALEVVLECNPAEVIIGDAPVQGCLWAQMLSTTFLDKIKRLSDLYNISVVVRDFRRTVFNPYVNELNQELHPLNNYIIFDLGRGSYLEPVSSIGKNMFRVILYNPDGFKESHRRGMHKYCISKALFESDVVISLPKIKTHQRTCITGGLKNIVGLNGDKDFLPHHRLGGTGNGGDCYEGKNHLRYWAELSQDAANRKQGTILFRPWLKVSGLLWELSIPKEDDDLGAGWYGNDTTWRMVMDLNTIALYGRLDGSLSDEPQRVLYSLCDAIIAGEGDGPLHPEPFPMGIVSFSNDSALTDLCFGKLMGLKEDRIPLLKSAKESLAGKDFKILLDNMSSSFDQLDSQAYSPKLPKGWRNYLNR